RIEQLKTLTAVLGLASVADTVGHLIREQATRRIIPDTIPGFAIEGTSDGVSVAVGDALPVIYPRAVAEKIANTIRQVVSGEASGTADVTSDYIVMRPGNGVRLHFPFTAPAKSVSPDVARDVARLIEKAA